MIEPAWYDDEQDPSISRWHDGTDWTRHTVVKAEWSDEPPPPTDATLLPSDDERPDASSVSGGPPARRFVPPVQPLPFVRAAPDPPAPVAEVIALRVPVSAERAPAIPDPAVPQRRGRLLLPIVGALLVATLLLRVFVVNGDTGDDPYLTGLPTYTVDWTALDGATYRVTVVPSPRAGTEASRAGCIGRPTAGEVNARASVHIENRTAATVSVPDLEFTLASTGSDEVDPTGHPVEVAPLASGATCDLGANRLGPTGRDPLASGGVATFEATAGGIAVPAATGLVLVVRFTRGAPADGEVPSFADLVVPLSPASIGR